MRGNLIFSNISIENLTRADESADGRANKPNSSIGNTNGRNEQGNSFHRSMNGRDSSPNRCDINANGCANNSNGRMTSPKSFSNNAKSFQIEPNGRDEFLLALIRPSTSSGHLLPVGEGFLPSPHGRGSLRWQSERGEG